MTIKKAVVEEVPEPKVIAFSESTDSGRTQISVEIDAFGKGVILVNRDGHGLLRYDLMTEQKPVNG